MLDLTPASVPPWFSVDEVAEVAGVPAEDAWRMVGLGQAVLWPEGCLVSSIEAVHLVRVLRGDVRPSRNRVLFNQIPGPSKAKRRGLAATGLLGLYGLGALFFLVVNSLGLIGPSEVVLATKNDAPVRLVYLMMPGPGGGGGGGGLREPQPAPPARKKTEVARKTPSRVPPARPQPAPPPPRPVPPRPETRIEPTPVIDKPAVPTPPAPAVQAPVQPIAADPLEAVGLPNESPMSAPSRGPGNGGGVGSGSGQGIGEGSGGGIGPGSGGGTGGGPYQPGAGIDPPTLVREVRPTYTDAARRQAIEGDVVLEIIVRQDGSVGNIRVLRSLGAGLEQKAIEAVRQWRFNPAKRHGTPVDVVVQVSVEFKLR